jgi:two-component system sensor histidine kinase KdpD
VAVVVETPETGRDSFDRKRDLQEAIDDAVDLGAQVVRVEAADVVTGLANVARSRRTSHLVLPYRPREGMKRLTERPLSELVLDQLPQVKLHLVRDAATS